MRKLTIAATLAITIAAAAETHAASARPAQQSFDRRDRSPITRIIRVIKNMWSSASNSLPSIPIP